MVEVVVEFDYKAVEEDELSIRVGEVISNVIRHDGGWWEGEINGRKGMFPDNFVKEIKKDKDKPRDTGGLSKKSAGGGSSHVAELANKLGNIKLGPSSGGSSTKSASQTNTAGAVVKRDVSKRKKRAKVAYSYTPSNEDELRLEVGNIIEILKQEEEGWWEGNLNGKVGMFPSNFVEVVEEDKEKQSLGHADEGDASKEDISQIQGKKVRGVGLGNIFSEGPIKLRSTTATIPRKSKQKDGEKKPESENSAPSQSQEQEHRQTGGASKKAAAVNRDPPTLPPKEQPREPKQAPSGLLEEGYVFTGQFVDIAPTKVLSRALEVIPEVEQLSGSAEFHKDYFDLVKSEVEPVNSLSGPFLSPSGMNSGVDSGTELAIAVDDKINMSETSVDDVPMELSGLSLARETPPPRPTFRKRRSVSKGTPRDSPALPLHQSTPNTSEMPPVKKHRSSLLEDAGSFRINFCPENLTSTPGTYPILSNIMTNGDSGNPGFNNVPEKDLRVLDEKEMAYNRPFLKSQSDPCIQSGNHNLRKAVSFAAKDDVICGHGIDQPPYESKFISPPSSIMNPKTPPHTLDGRRITDSIQLLRHRLAFREELSSGVDEAIQASEHDIMSSLMSEDEDSSRTSQRSSSSLGRLFNQMVSIFSPRKINLSPLSSTYKFFDSVASTSELEPMQKILPDQIGGCVNSAAETVIPETSKSAEAVAVHSTDNPSTPVAEGDPSRSKKDEADEKLDNQKNTDNRNETKNVSQTSKSDPITKPEKSPKKRRSFLSFSTSLLDVFKPVRNPVPVHSEDVRVHATATEKLEPREERGEQESANRIGHNGASNQKIPSDSKLKKIKKTNTSENDLVSAVDYGGDKPLNTASCTGNDQTESGVKRSKRKTTSRWSSLTRFSAHLLKRPTFRKNKKKDLEVPVQFPVEQESKPPESTYLETLHQMGRLPPVIRRVSSRYDIYPTSKSIRRSSLYDTPDLMSDPPKSGSLPLLFENTDSNLSRWSSLPPSPGKSQVLESKGKQPETRKQKLLKHLKRRATISGIREANKAKKQEKEEVKQGASKMKLKGKSSVKTVASGQSKASDGSIMARVKRSLSVASRRSLSLPRYPKFSFHRNRVGVSPEDTGSVESPLCSSFDIFSATGGEAKHRGLDSPPKSCLTDENLYSMSPSHDGHVIGNTSLVNESAKEHINQVLGNQEIDVTELSPTDSELSRIASHIVSSTIYTVLTEKIDSPTCGSVEAFFCRDTSDREPQWGAAAERNQYCSIECTPPGQLEYNVHNVEDDDVFGIRQIFDRMQHDSRPSIDLNSNTSNISLRGSSVDERSLAEILASEMDVYSPATCRSDTEIVNKNVLSPIVYNNRHPTGKGPNFWSSYDNTKLPEIVVNEPLEIGPVDNESFDSCPVPGFTGTPSNFQCSKNVPRFLEVPESAALDLSFYWIDNASAPSIDTSYTRMDEKVASFLLGDQLNDTYSISEGSDMCDEVSKEMDNSNNNCEILPLSSIATQSACHEEKTPSFIWSSPLQRGQLEGPMFVVVKPEQTAYEKLDSMVPSFVAPVPRLECADPVDDELLNTSVEALSPETEARLNELVANTSANALSFYSLSGIDSVPGSPELLDIDPDTESGLQL